MGGSRRRGAALVVGLLLVASSLPVSARPSVAGAADDGPLLVEAMPAAQARSEVGIAALQSANAHLPASTVSRLLTDDTTWADPAGRLYVIDPAHAPDVRASTTGDPVLDAPHPLSQTFLLHSLPGAQRVIYLDFEGESVSGTGWSSGTITVDPFTLDGDLAFSDAEKAFVQDVWLRMAEDFAPFAIDVTTQDPGFAAINRSNSGDQQYGTRVVFDTTNGCYCGGVAYVGVFNSTFQHAYYQPAWVYPESLALDSKSTAEAASHEVGHNLGLSHDGKGDDDYYAGHAPWAPIMGVGYHQPVTQWSSGAYTDATNAEDDLAVIPAYGGTLRTDDHGDVAAAATVLASPAFDVAGVIERSTDVDAFSLTVPAGPLHIAAYVAPTGPNLDLRLRVSDAGGAVLDDVDPTVVRTNEDSASGLSAAVDLVVPAGTYTIRVSPVGSGNPSTNGYPVYGSLGRYRLTSSSTVLTVVPTGVAGSVESDPPGISCPGTCSATFDVDENVELVATPTAGARVKGWTGASCSRHEPCTITMNAPRTIGVEFEPIPHHTVQIVKAGNGTGTVTANSGDIDCGATCADDYVDGTWIFLEATPAPGSVFTSWSEPNCTGSWPSCSVSVTGPRTITATFSAAHQLDVDVTGDGAVTDQAGPLSCPGTCTADYTVGAVVELWPSAWGTSAFSEWGGACSGTIVPCTVTMSVPRSVSAAFVEGTLLSVDIAGTEGDPEIGRVAVDAGGLACESPTCELYVVPDSTVTLTAQTGGRGQFLGWSGGCTGTGPCVLSMTEARAVTATFAELDVKILQVDSYGSGSGTITSTPAGISCPPTCAGFFDTDSTVQLTATPAAGAYFAGWFDVDGECSGTGQCTLPMDDDRSVTAVFELESFLFQVSRTGGGQGSVTSDPAGIDCGSTCLNVFDYGTVVTLTPAAASGSEFAGWSGACTGTGACQVTVTQSRSVTAAFAKQTVLLSVSKAGGGQGTVTSSPTRISCGVTCSASFDVGSTVTLAAVAASTSSFGGWSGDCLSTAGTICTVGMSAARSVTATFNSKLPDPPPPVTALPGPARVALTWIAPASPIDAPITDYVIQRSKNGGRWTTLSDGRNTRTYYTSKSLSNGSGYRFRVAAKNKHGQGPWIETGTVVPRTVPGTPRSVKLVAGDGQLAVTWLAPSSTGGSPITDYRIQTSLDGKVWTVVDDGVGISTQFTLTGLTNGVRYRVKVAATNVAGTGSNTSTKYGTPKAPAPVVRR